MYNKIFEELQKQTALLSSILEKMDENAGRGITLVTSDTWRKARKAESSGESTDDDEDLTPNREDLLEELLETRRDRDHILRELCALRAETLKELNQQSAVQKDILATARTDVLSQRIAKRILGNDLKELNKIEDKRVFGESEGDSEKTQLPRIPADDD